MSAERANIGFERIFRVTLMAIETNTRDVSRVKGRRQRPWRATGSRKITTVLARWLDAALRRHIDKRVA